MKKKFLDNQVMESAVKQIERDWKNQKINTVALNQDDLAKFKEGIIKGEKIMQIEFNEVVVESDFHRTGIVKYEGFYLVEERINFFGKPKQQKTNYYKIKY